MMYNAELKKRYIEEKSKEVIMSPNYLGIQFEKIAETEQELNKDVSNFTVYEILEYYKTLNVSSLETLSVLNSTLSLYTQWCLQQNLVTDNQNHFLEIGVSNFQACVNKALAKMKIVSQETVHDWVDKLLNPKDQFTLLGLFEGIKGKEFCELMNLRPKDVSGNTLTLCTGRSIEVSDKLIEIIDKCIKEELYYSSSYKYEKVIKLVDRGYIIKDYPNALEDVSSYQKGRKLYNGIIRALKNVGVDAYIRSNDIFESGKLHMIKERSKELKIHPKAYIYSDYITEVEEKYNTRIVRSVFWTKYKDYLA